MDADAAGLMLADQRGNLQLVASTLERAQLLELFELQAGEGPCLECFAIGQAMADVATIGLLHERNLREQTALSEQLQTALHSRVLIEQAKGVLAARTGITVTDAFTRMRTHARRNGLTLTTVATAVIDGTVDARALTGS